MALLLVGLMGAVGCNRPPSTQQQQQASAQQRSTQQRSTQQPVAAAPKSAAPRSVDPVVGTVDGTPIALSWVRARLTNAETDLSAGEAAATALLAAAADVICLREFAVLDLRPLPNETPQAAVDRLLAGTWRSDAGCHADPGDLKLAYLNAPSRWRHPTALTLWEAQISCCNNEGESGGQGECDNPAHSAELDRCIRRTEATAKALHSALQAALPPPLAVTRASLADSPARARHLPAFERALADFRGQPTPEMLRYTAFAREEAFRKMAFRRTNPALERAALPLPIGALTPPVRTSSGWSVALIVGHEPPRHGGLHDPATRRALRAEVCARQAAGQRASYRDRMLQNARIIWRRDVIRTQLGEAAEQALPQRAGPAARPRR